MLFICQWLLFVDVMQLQDNMKWNANVVWGNSLLCIDRRAEFTFTITVMIQSSLIIILLTGMQAQIANVLYFSCILSKLFVLRDHF